MTFNLGIGSKGSGSWVVFLLFLVSLGGGAMTLTSCKEKGHSGREAGATVYYCPMHPQIKQDKPGTCPICSMDLVLLEAPRKKADEMSKEEGVPDSLKGLAPVHLTAWKQQLIGIRTAPVEKKEVRRIIRTVGRFGGGGFAAAASDFAASGRVTSGGARYVVADIYALDQPFLRQGQRAWVSTLEGSGGRVAARVGQIFPYDETQSRVVRVRLNLDKPLKGGLFANVEIEANSGVRLAIPNDAVMDTGTVRYVFVEAEPGHFTPREVELGLRGEEDWEILSGVRVGEKVVMGANFLLDADAKLKSVLSSHSVESQHKH